MLSKEVLLQLEEAKDAKDLQAMAKKLGYDLTDVEAEKVFAMFEQDLSDEELEKVAGGLRRNCNNHNYEDCRRQN